MHNLDSAQLLHSLQTGFISKAHHSIKYKDYFIDNTRFDWMSKTKDI
jgi:hypothetical protein